MESWTIIIFGMSGDLAKRQIIPALYELFRTNGDKNQFTVIGAARDATTIETIIEQARQFIPDATEATLQAFAARCSYYQLDFEDAAAFATFARALPATQQRIAYLAVAANFFCTLTEQLAEQRIIERGKKTQRIVYEKPFGWDGASAQQINGCIAKHIDEVQVYRVDHYLTKEIVNHILLMRSKNTMFEKAWNHQHIDHVDIILDETLGMEGRGAYYDQYGALKDVVQNHMLQMLALVAMEQPASHDYHAMQQQKVAVLTHVTAQQCIFAQYEDYRQEPHVKPDSTTETFVACRLQVNTPRWKNVPFYLHTGKRLQKKMTAITIAFKDVAPCFTSAANSCLHVPETANAYAALLCDIMAGDRTITVSPAEIAAQWAIIEQIYALQPPLLTYAQGSNGPAEKITPHADERTS